MRDALQSLEKRHGGRPKMAVDHELTFCSQASEWMNEQLNADHSLAFGQVKIEQSAAKSSRRRDLTIFDRSNKIAITGEVKLPYMADGATPYSDKVIDDAFVKAARVNAAYFITWNVNRLVLWLTDDKSKPLLERNIYELPITQVRDANDLANPSVQQEIRRGLNQFLNRATQAYKGEIPLSKRPLDEFFISILEAGLDRPIATVLQAIYSKYQSSGTFKISLDEWMRDTQGWHLSDDALIQRDNLERAAKFSCYVLVNKIVFYKALRKRYTKLPNITLPKRILSASDASGHIQDFFDRARKATRDYETIFRGDFGDTIPFLDDQTVPAWRDFLESIDRFDFTALNYDVIGPIFQRLIEPEERRRYGQHYTNPEVCDLINSFCIRRPNARVMDPACGGGTFLVRAYNRKRALGERAHAPLAHTDLIDHLFGVDVSAYASHLTTINLATRDLIDERNYPLVATSDFFEVEPGQALLSVPMASKTGKKQMQPVYLPQLDAIVGNPPYVRQEEISKPPTTSQKPRGRITGRSLDQIKEEAVEYKRGLKQKAALADPLIDFSGRSDLHIYFWPHATRFLKPDGYLGLLTSSGWLDADYGFSLQEFLLKHYAILAIFESVAEPWFTGARVMTCATMTRREPDASRRGKNIVRFVRLRRRLDEILEHGSDEGRRQRAVEDFRNRIESLDSNYDDQDIRVRVIRQAELEAAGSVILDSAQPGKPMSIGEADDQHERSDQENDSAYAGSKWGIYLRAPDFFFEFKERHSARLVPLSVIADVKFGTKTGADGFFMPRDVTDRCLREIGNAARFRAKFGIKPSQCESIRIIEPKDGSLHLVERKYLEPEVHSLMGLKRAVIDREAMQDRCILLCGEDKSRLRGTHLLKYIQWGEREHVNSSVSVATRAASRNWYDISDCVRPTVILPKIQQYRHIVPVNPDRWTCNSSLLAVTSDFDPWLIAGILNSTIVGFLKWYYGRQLGNEANLQIDVYSAKTIPVPDPRGASSEFTNRIVDAMKVLSSRQIEDLDIDVLRDDRRELDNAVLGLLGETNEERRVQTLASLYEEVITLHSVMKDKERIAADNRASTSRGTSISPEQMTNEIWSGLDRALLKGFPEDFIGARDETEELELPDGECTIYNHPLLNHVGVEIGGREIDLDDERRAILVKTIVDAGLRGHVRIPKKPTTCAKLTKDFLVHRNQVTQELLRSAAERSSNERMQAKVVSLLERKLASHMTDPIEFED